MKKLLILIIIICFYSKANSQVLPEFNDKPAYFDVQTKTLIELEKSSYNTITKAKGVFKLEGGYFLNGNSSPIKITKQAQLKFIVKLSPGIDPTSVFDLVSFEVRKDQRLFITTTSKATSTKSSFKKITFELQKIKEGYYYLIITDLEKGEYFFGSKDLMFAFSVI